MSKELLLIVETVANEKDVSENVVFEALESALEVASKKQYQDEVEIRVNIDRETGEYITYRCYFVKDEEEIEFPGKELTLEQAKEMAPDLEEYVVVEEKIENLPFKRVGAHVARQAMFQRIREAERENVYNLYASKEGELINGVVKHTDRGNVIVDLLDNVEGIIFKEELIPNEKVRKGQRIRSYVKKVTRESKGHQIILSRTSLNLLTELFSLEVPEIANGAIEIKSGAREAGVRSKIAVYSSDPRIDPVGSCIGIRGSRIQNITNELAGEKIDIIVWQEEPVEFVIKAIAPAEPTAIIVDEEKHAMSLSFPEDKLAIAVGRGGQNVRLASELTGWRLNVMTEEDFAKKDSDEKEKVTSFFVEKLDIDTDIAEILVREGFSTIEEIGYIDINELYSIEEFDEDIANELRDRASDILLTKALSAEEEIEGGDSEAIETLSGVSQELLLQFKLNGLQTWDDLAELSTDELVEMTGIEDKEAAELILKARAPWFEE